MRRLDKSEEIYVVEPESIVSAKNFIAFEIYESNADDQKHIGLMIQLDETGTESWRLATQKAIGKQLAFILNNEMLEVAEVMAQVTAGITAINRGIYTQEELENFKTILENER